jgi:glycogen operon protein
MIALRMKHEVIRGKTKPAICGLADISLHGASAYHPGESHDDRYIGVMYAGRSRGDRYDDILYIGLNMWWEWQAIELPVLPAGLCWHKAVHTWEEPSFFDEKRRIALRGNDFVLGPRSVAVFIAGEEQL